MATEKLKMAKPAKPQPEYLTQQPPTSANFEALERYISGLEAERARTAPGPESSISRRALGDTGLALVKGAMAVPQAAVGLADLATGGRVGRALEEGVDVGGVRLGFRPKEAGAALDEMMTPEAQAAQRRVQEAQGFLETTLAAIQNPSVIVNSAAESLPLMGGGGVIGRALMKMAPAIGAVGAGAAGEGITTMGSQAESIRQETRDGLLTGDQALLAAGSGAATGMLGLLGGRIAQRLGIADVDTLLTGKADQQMTKGFLRLVLEGAVSEGLLEELPQSVQEQVAQNLALGKPLGEGVPQAAVLGALTGGLMGAGGNLLAGSPASQIRQQKAGIDAGPVARAHDAGLEATAQAAEQAQAAATALAEAAPVVEDASIPPEVLGEQPGAPESVSSVSPVVEPAPAETVALPAAAPVAPETAPIEPAVAPPRPPEEPPPEETAAARAQRDADRPPEPAGEPQPGDITTPSGTPFKTMRAAMRAQAGAGPGAELVPVAGGLVVRPAAAQGVEQGVTPPQPQQEPVQPTLAGVEPAVQPPKAPPADPLPDDILNKDGKPFTNRGAAANEMRRRGDGFTIREVVGGFAVRRLDDALAGKAPTAATIVPVRNGDRTGLVVRQKQSGGAPAFNRDAVENALIAERDSFANVPMRDRTPLQHAIYDAVTASTVDPTDMATESMIRTALENGRRDLAELIVARAESAAQATSTTPGVSKDSPKYAGIAAALQERKNASSAAAERLRALLDAGTAPTATEAPRIDEAAHEAAPSPQNDLPEPTEAQKEAGNYKVGRVRISGMEVSIETPKGAERSSKADAPQPSPPESPKPAADAGQRQETAAPSASSATPAQRWDGMPAADRERALLAAGWKSGSDGTKAMQGKAWDGMTPSQQARIARVLEQQRENAPAQQEPAEPPPAAKTEGATSEGETDGQEEGRRQEGLLNREPAPKVDEAPEPATKVEDEKPSDAKAKTAAAARQAIDERIEVLRGMVKDDESAATRALRKRIEVLQALRRCVG